MVYGILQDTKFSIFYSTFILPIASPTSSYFCQLSCPPSFIYQLNIFLATAFPPPVHHPCNLSTISKLLRLLLGIPTSHATVFILPRVLIFLAPAPFDLPLAGRARNVAFYIRNVHPSGEFPRPAAIARNDPYGFSLAWNTRRLHARFVSSAARTRWALLAREENGPDLARHATEMERFYGGALLWVTHRTFRSVFEA